MGIVLLQKNKYNTTTWIALEKSHNENKHTGVGVCLLDFLLMNNLIKHFLTHQNENIVVRNIIWKQFSFLAPN